MIGWLDCPDCGGKGLPSCNPHSPQPAAFMEGDRGKCSQCGSMLLVEVYEDDDGVPFARCEVIDDPDDEAPPSLEDVEP